MKNQQQGFTLIELMIVVAVIGVLSAIAVPQYQNYVKKSELGAALATVAALKVNVEDYIATNSVFPTKNAAATISELGAPSSAIGTIISTGNTSASAAGNIILQLSSTALPASTLIAMHRSDTGNWECKSTASSAAILPRGCTNETAANINSGE
ncbi:pilin [Vibrio tapetis subsp. quintayensis]|uniref:pilin n=1 Tax=Vibrio tapetis TaxID=52443 RepID=UPI0025B48AAF|nr:pilin [Vibrio tapetis]MDN3681533.1 pilin [Vibrio tapetis subsp. quintayensis]